MKRFFFGLLFFTVFVANAQQVPVNSSLKIVVTSLNNFRERLPVEKLYLQTDKPYYNTGDTIRFKSYLLNADFLTSSLRSSLLYVELDDVSDRMVKRIMVPVATGVSWGDMALDPIEVPEGSYTLRAYTNWMRNFGEDYIFKKNIYVSSTSGTSTLVKADFKLADKGDKTTIQANLRFTDINKRTLGLRDMNLRVMNGRRTLFRDKNATNVDGTMDINFDLVDKATIKNLAIQVQYRSKDADTSTLTIPVTINRTENTDVQFMPEGGNLVAGITAKIGFKAIGEDGKGVTVSGKIYNSKQQEVAVFKSTHKGMGSFEFVPQLNESYTAKIDQPIGVAKSYLLPAVHSSGTTLKVISKTDSLEVFLSATPDAMNNTYYLIGQARGVVCYASAVDLKSGSVKKAIAKSVFPTGIAHFTLLTNTNIPLNERITYIGHDDNLQIAISSNKSIYNLRDSIALAVTVKDKDGKPVEGTFSLAVTDNDQVKTDTLGSNMLNNLLFTSDLKGTVEEPGYYFAENTPQRAAELDNLLLSQGWVGYDWKDVFTPKTEPRFLAEKDFIIQGKVTNIFNKGIEKSQVLIFSRKPEIVKDTMTDKDGLFTFKGFYPTDTAEYKIQARNKSGQSFNIGVDMLNEFKQPVFAATEAIAPWYVNSDTVLLNNSNIKTAQLKAEANYSGEGRLLKTVEIKDKKLVKDSKNLNGPGEADLVLDEQDLLKARKMTLGDLLKQKVKNFMVKGVWMPCMPGGKCFILPTSYLIGDMLLFFSFDGTLLRAPLPPQDHGNRYTEIKAYMDYFTAEDIKGIEVMSSAQFAGIYGNRYVKMYSGSIPTAFIEITTRAGKGPIMKSTAGTYLYKPLAFTLPKEFYRPRYTVSNINNVVGWDMRSTIHWEPNLVTDKDGKGTVSFFSADKPADYIIIMEGTDLNGNIGYRRQKIKVMAKK